MITNNSYIRSDYGVINKNIIAQTKLNEYDKENNKNFLTTKEYVDTKINNFKVKINYTIGVPYIHIINNNSIVPYSKSSENNYDFDGKKILYNYSFSLNESGSLITDEYFIIKELDENGIYRYKLIKGEPDENDDKLIITEKIDLMEGIILFCKYDLQYYTLISYNYIENNGSVSNKQIITSINNLIIFDTNILTTPKKLNDKITFNIMNPQIINHNINLSNLSINELFNNIFINDMLSKFINPPPPATSIYLINEFYRNYFKDILKLYNDEYYNYYFDRLIKDANQIIYFKSYSGIPKINISRESGTNDYIIKTPKNTSLSPFFNEFKLINTYQNLKEENFYVILRYKENITISNTNYEIYTAEIELNNNGTIETNIIDIKYEENTNNVSNNNCNFETNNYNSTFLHFILINYDKQHILDISYTLNNNVKIYTINIFDTNYIIDTTFYKDLTLLCNLNIHYNIEYSQYETNQEKIDNFITKEEFKYTFTPLSSYEQQRVKDWEYDNINGNDSYDIIIPQYIYFDIPNYD